MSAIPEELKYTREHEWIRIEGGTAVEGITDYAQTELSDVVYVELPKVGTEVKMNEKCGAIEAVKAVVDLYAGVSGEVTEINEKLSSAPENVNSDPYGEGWMLKIKVKDPSELDSLLSAKEYDTHVKEAGH
jgi:glycine cleavage system H protein